MEDLRAVVEELLVRVNALERKTTEAVTTVIDQRRNTLAYREKLAKKINSLWGSMMEVAVVVGELKETDRHNKLVKELERGLKESEELYAQMVADLKTLEETV